MQASSNREENRTVLSFMAHLSLTFLVFSFFVFTFLSSFYLFFFSIFFFSFPSSRSSMPGYMLSRFRRAASSETDRPDEIDRSFEWSHEVSRNYLDEVLASHASFNGHDIAVLSGILGWKSRPSPMSTVGPNKREINVIVNGQHDNTTRTTIMWHDDHRSVQAHRNRSCRYKVNCYISQRHDRVYIISR